MPKNEFADGKVDFEIGTGATSSGAQGGFEIGLVDPYDNNDPSGKPDFDMKGEIIEVGPGPSVEAPMHRIVMSVNGTPKIYEDADMAGGDASQTVAVYNVNFDLYDRNGAHSDGEPVAGDVNFRLTFIPRGSSVNFDPNLADNAYLDNWVNGEGVGDVGLNLAFPAYTDSEGNQQPVSTGIYGRLDEL